MIRISVAPGDTRFIDIDEKTNPLQKEELSLTSPDLQEVLFACINEFVSRTCALGILDICEALAVGIVYSLPTFQEQFVSTL